MPINQYPPASGGGGGVTSFNTRTGAVTLNGTDVSGALGFTPYSAANPSGYVDQAGARAAVSASGSLSYNPATGIFSYTQPTNVSAFSNDAGYITSAALSPYLTSATAASTYQPLDADLTAIAGLAGTSGLLRKTALNTWSLDTSTYSITNSEASLGADVQLPVSSTWYDGPSLSLAAGTWLVQGHITFWRTTTTATIWFGRITDGTNHFASSQAYTASVAGTGANVAMTSTLTLASTTTIKLQGTTSAGATTCLMKAALTANGSGNNATQITAIRLA